MRKIIVVTIAFLYTCVIIAQKKPLDHSVYDGWQSIGEKWISNDGKWIVYTINPQEGDNELVIQSADAKYKKTVPRGDSALITEDSRYVIFTINPPFKEVREAKIKKKRGDDLPKDSLAIIELGKENIWKTPRVKSYQAPPKGSGWVAYHMERKPGAPGRPAGEKKTVDSLIRLIDSLQSVIAKMPRTAPTNRDDLYNDAGWLADADEPDTSSASRETGTDLVLRNLEKGEEKIFKNILEYKFSKDGHHLLLEQSRDPLAAASRPTVLYYDLRRELADTLSRGGNDFKNFAISEDGLQVAFLAERDAKPKDLQKLYKLWYYRGGMDSAMLLVDRNTTGMQLGMVVSEFGRLEFSKSGKRLFFGTAPLTPPRDTMLVDIDMVKLDIWHYNDDYLQTTQLNRLKRDQQENFLAVYHFSSKTIQQLGSRAIPQVYPSNEGDGDQFAGVTDVGKRIESQWEGNTRKDIFSINVSDGTNKLVKNDLKGVITSSYLSPTGRYIMWYDSKLKNYFVWDGISAKNISDKIKTSLADELHDSPSDPSPYGVMGWAEGDSAVYVYDRYDIWKIDPATEETRCITQEEGRKSRIVHRYLRLDPEENFIRSGVIMLRRFNEVTKESGLHLLNLPEYALAVKNFHFAPVESAFNIAQVQGADHGTGKGVFIYTKENYRQSPNLFVGRLVPEYDQPVHGSIIYSLRDTALSSINAQQQQYNWGTAELFKWRTYNGNETEGIVYKPEDFNPSKKYPLICYFYETLTDGLNNYIPPAPTPSRLNISFFVSRGYVVLAPDIHYTTGHPGKDAFDHVVSGARALVKKGFIDSTRMAIQGQSWGGYQVSYIITATNLFKAAWAGAPVANMTSAYGGIRWESGLNRQFQYEKTQSRIGATLWEKPQLYIENSPLFHLPKVKTPLVIMHNDADGAVPWYQGIELFTAMRRLGKKVWMLNYNGEAHNLVERKNRKDIQVREQQYFDWLLKDERPARWLTEGVPAVNKGRDWGLD